MDDTPSVTAVAVGMSMEGALEGGAEIGAFCVAVTGAALAVLAPLAASFKREWRRPGVLEETVAPEAVA